MKIALQQVVAAPREDPGVNAFCSIQEKLYGEIARRDTQIVVKIPSLGIVNPDLNIYLGLRSINDIALVKSMVEVEKEGVDAIVVVCWFDSGVETARRIIDIPVVGICEASLHLASVMGSKFAVITSDPQYIPSMEEQIHHYKMTDKAIAIRPVRATLLGLADEHEALQSEKYDPICEDFTKIAEGCIADGAEVIICGCALLANVLTLGRVTEIEGVPIINPASVSIKWAEMLVDLKSLGMPIISRKGINIAPTPEEAEALLKAVCK